jgi:hypothetical protein
MMTTSAFLHDRNASCRPRCTPGEQRRLHIHDSRNRELEHEVPRSGHRDRRRCPDPRVQPAAADAGRHAPRVQPADRRGPGRGARSVRRGGRAAHHRAARAGSAQRRSVPRRDRVGVPAGPVVGGDDVRGGNGHPRRAPGRRRAPDPGRRRGRAARGVQAAADAPAAIVDQPRCDGAADLRDAVADRDVGARPVADRSATARRRGRRQRRDLGLP